MIVAFDRDRLDKIHDETVIQSEGGKEAQQEFEKKRDDFVSSEVEEAKSQLEKREAVEPVDVLPEQGLILLEARETALDDLLKLEYVRSLIPKTKFQDAKEQTQNRTTTNS